MKRIQCLLVVCLLLVASRAHASFTLNLSDLNDYDHGHDIYSNLSLINATGGSGLVTLTTAGAGIVAAGDLFNTTFDIPVANFTKEGGSQVGLHFYTTGDGSTTTTYTDSLTLKGIANGTFVDSTHFVYNTGSLALQYSITKYVTDNNTGDVLSASTIDKGNVATASISNVQSGGVLTDGFFTGSYSLTSILSDLANVFSINGVSLNSFSGALALTGGHFSEIESGVPQTTFNGTDYVTTQGVTALGANVALATPEPATLLIMGSGLLGMFAVRRRKKAS